MIAKDDACVSDYLDELSDAESQLAATQNDLAAWQAEQQRLADVEFEIIEEQWTKIYEENDWAQLNSEGEWAIWL